MIKVTIGNTTFECTSAAEAVEVHRLVNARPLVTTTMTSQVEGRPRLQPRHPSGAVVVAAHHGDGNGIDQLEVFRKLYPHRGREFTSQELVEILGVKTANGVGPKFAALREELQSLDPPVDLDKYIRSRTYQDGSKRWQIQQW